MNPIFKNKGTGWIRQFCQNSGREWYISKEVYINRLKRFGFGTNTFVSNMHYSNLEYKKTYNFSFFEF